MANAPLNENSGHENLELDDTLSSTSRIQLERASLRNGQSMPGFTGAVSAEGVHLLDYVRVLYKRRWTGLMVFGLVFATAVLHAYTATPIYEAKARILIEADNPNVVNFREVIEEQTAKTDYYQTQYNILQSRALARRTLDSLNLWNVEPFGGAPKKQGFSLMRMAQNVVLAVTAPFRGEPAESENLIPGADETAAQSAAIDAFLGRLTVAPIRTSRLVDIKYRLPDAKLSADIVNAQTKNYIEQTLEYKFLASKEASDWLSERLAEQRKQVELAESKLQQYREQNDAISIEDHENIVVQKLADLNAAVTRAKTERIQKESMFRELRESQADPARLDSFPAILSNASIQQQKAELSALQAEQARLSEKFLDKHPQVVAVQTAIKNKQANLQAEIQRVVQSIRSEYQTALAQEQSLSSALNEQKGQALSMNRKEITYAVLQRDVDSSKQIYDSLMQRAKETGISGELKTSNIRVVDPAERPRGPVSPQRQMELVLGLLVGFVLGCAVVFFFEYLDSRIKTPDEIRTHLKIPCLGLLPRVNEKVLGGKYPLLLEAVPSNYSEAFRAVRTNVLFSSAKEGSHSVVVTSTGPGEGKSSVASNLAISLAQAGQRVLLMDADMRKPRVHEIFSTPLEPGLSNVLVGNAKASEAVRRSPVPGLWCINAGHMPPNPAELIASTRFRDFLASVSEHFDWVIIDSPPVMAVTDAALAAHHATGVLFVVGAEMTSRHAAKRALDQLESAQGRFIGAVLNRVDLERNAYYYSQYYRREYATYYQQAG